MSDRILTSVDLYGDGDPMAAELHQTAAALRAGMVAAPRPAPVATSAVETVAYVNYGRWVADCPDPNCGSAQAVSPSSATYYCPACGNVAVNGRWVKLTFPSDRGRVEALLAVRPQPEARNWKPPESAATLAAENAERGL